MRFEQRVFTDVELRKAAKRPLNYAATLAKRFAAKEAFSKAVGTGLKGRGVHARHRRGQRPVRCADAGADRRREGAA
ncbi:4'-phosphopantetheinyl transferase superfamily domain-containing protein [Ditylenchus destructor]|uniref:L-aminoadipate-semialdehyde dehydrogenase-phosphopantetheinyl transferase n=1 Tax=Ditylenchus destructor TaxID=166010 RepID=A0AAD4QUT6_9BILA|nr:4'-phosphopantetheinyl transferase superfamily domain-containing protein [Ditylenchus destructor]